MRFFYAKKDHVCFYCRAEIKQGEAFVRLEVKNRQGDGKIGLIFHPDCFPQWNEETFTRRFLDWERNQTPPKKRGRPRKYIDGAEVKRLKALQTYYRDKYWDDEKVNKVSELEAKIQMLTIA